MCVCVCVCVSVFACMGMYRCISTVYTYTCYYLWIHKSPSSSLALQPNAGLRLHNGPPPLNLSDAIWFLNRQFFTGWGCQPYAQPPTWRTRSYMYNPRNWVAQLYPQALGTYLSRLLRHAWATIGLFFTPGQHMGYIYIYLCVCMYIRVCVFLYVRAWVCVGTYRL